MPLKAGSDEWNQVRFCLRRTGAPPTCPNIGNIFNLKRGTTIVGRNPARSDIFLDSAVHKALISRLHARIAIGPDNRVKICDTSLNGTYVNDRKILDTVEINPGDTVTFGHLKGAVLVPGTVAKQFKSEFRFKLEKSIANEVGDPGTEPRKENHQVNNKTNYQGAGFIPDLSPFIKKVRTDSQDIEDPAKKDDDGPSNGSLDTSTSLADSEIHDAYSRDDDNSSDNDDLIAFAAAAEGAMDEESDSELFSVSMPSQLYVPDNHLPDVINHPGMSPAYLSQAVIVQRKNENGPLDNPSTMIMLNPREENDKEEKQLMTHERTSKQLGKSSKKLKRKSLPYSSKKRKHTQASKSHEEAAIQDQCGFGADCLFPHSHQEIVSWVQCDFCQEWYHLECAGLTLNSVTGKLKKFNCGCV